MPCRHVSPTFNITRIKCHSEALPRGLRKFAQDGSVSLRDPLWVVAIPKIGVCPPVQAAPPSNAGIATVVTLLRNDGMGQKQRKIKNL